MQSAEVAATPGQMETGLCPRLVPCVPSCCMVLLFGALGAGWVTLPRESQRKQMSFNPTPTSPGSAVVRNMILRDILVPEKIGLMCKQALLFH